MEIRAQKLCTLNRTPWFIPFLRQGTLYYNHGNTEWKNCLMVCWADFVGWYTWCWTDWIKCLILLCRSQSTNFHESISRLMQKAILVCLLVFACVCVCTWIHRNSNKIKQLTFEWPSAVLSVLSTFIHLIFTIALWGRFYFFQLMDEKIKIEGI